MIVLIKPTISTNTYQIGAKVGRPCAHINGIEQFDSLRIKSFAFECFNVSPNIIALLHALLCNIRMKNGGRYFDVDGVDFNARINCIKSDCTRDLIPSIIGIEHKLSRLQFLSLVLMLL